MGRNISRLTKNDHVRLQRLKPLGVIRLTFSGNDFDPVLWKNAIRGFAKYHYGAGNYSVESLDYLTVKLHRHQKRYTENAKAVQARRYRQGFSS